MRLERLDIQRLPGIQPGFVLDALDPGVNVVVGPNASGKSSLLRALRAALYPQELRHSGVQVEARFADDQGTLEAHRVGTDLYWTRNGERIDPPLLPDHRFLTCYTLHIEDLLVADHATEQAIGARLARELAGGYDLPALRATPGLTLKTTHARNEAQALAAAEQDLRQRTREQRALQADEQRLDELGQERQAAQQAGDEAAQHERALELLESRRERQGLEARLEALPAGLAQLHGDEIETLEHLQGEIRRLDHELQQTRARIEDARNRLAETGLADSHLDTATLDDQRPRVRHLQDLEGRHEQALREHHAAQTTLATAIEALGGKPDTTPSLDPTTLHQVEQSLETQRELRAGIARREEERAGLPEARSDLPEPEALRRARDELLHWLGAPRPTTRDGLWRTAAAVALLAAAAAIGVATLLVHWALVALAAPVVWGAWVLARPGHDAVPLQAAEARFRDSGIDPPATWTPDAVRERLATVDHELREAEAARRTTERHTQLDRELEEKNAAFAREQERLRETAQAVGFDPAQLDASLQRWIHLTSEYDRARNAETTARAEQERLHTQMAETRETLVAFLAEYTSAPAEPAPSAASLGQRLDRLASRLQARDEARRTEDDARRELARLEAEATRTRERIASLYARAKLEEGDEAGLRERLRQLPEWRQLDDQLREVRAREGDRGRHLEARPDLLAQVDQDAEDALRQAIAELRDRAGRRDELTQEITRIETEIDRAGRDRALEAARAGREQARDALDTRLDEALFAEASRLLLDQVEAEHEQTAQPAALRRARDWFRRFTRHQYELLFTAQETAQFAAHEAASGARRALVELSSGTRMQLVLAVRIAFALEAERGRVPLPLFLDEALGTTDPERFRAVAESLQLLAREDGRQIFYLTAQPEDARYWAVQDTPAQIIDLPAVRGGQHAITDTRDLVLPKPTSIPAPGNASAEDYAATLGVPAIDPWQDPAQIHLFHLLRDDLGTLHRLLGLGIATLGSLEALLHGSDAGILGEKPVRERLRARIDSTRAWVRAWRQGRGRPVDRGALEASGIVSDTFIGAVADLADQLNGDAEALIRELEQGTVKRFQTATRERLREWLTEQGYIDPESPNRATAIEHRVIATLQAYTDSKAEATTEGQALARSLQTGIQQG